ncbi:hypothetical protein ACSBR2_000448 [Camellia fascicularis]
MFAAGTKGGTPEKYLDFLGLKSIEDVNSKSMKIMDVTCQRGPSQNFTRGRGRDLIISFVNGAWESKCFPLAPSYQKLLSRVYSAESKVVDFQNKAKVASRGLITNILNPKSLSPDTSIILANGLYFKGTWSTEFDAKYTKNRDFYLFNGDTVSVLFMTNHRDKYLYKSFEGFKQDLGLNLDLVKLDEIWIPKFKFSYDFDVCDATQDVGHSLPFSENPTDFTEMIHVPKGIPFFVSNMFHKAFIEVDEKGTEAAVFSMCSMFSGCAMRQIEHSSFIADYLFLFMIKEEMSGLILFSGAVVNPI